MAEYIDREAALMYLNDIWLTATPTDSMPDDERELAMVRCKGLNDAIDAVKSIPAADVRSVVPGKWLPKNEIGDCCYQCSDCGFVRDAYILDIGNFCPNCGADMRGEQDV